MKNRFVWLHYMKADIPDWLTEDELRQALDEGKLSAVVTPMGNVELQANYNTPGDWYPRLKTETCFLYRALYIRPVEVSYHDWLMLYYDRAVLSWIYNVCPFEAKGGLTRDGHLSFNFPTQEDEENDD
jgi:hypothetical protein